MSQTVPLFRQLPTKANRYNVRQSLIGPSTAQSSAESTDDDVFLL